MSTITISDRDGKTIKEFLLQELQDNFWRLSKNVMLRMIGMEKEEVPGKRTGTRLNPRIKVPEIQMGRRFEVEHLHTPFGGGVHAAAENVALRSGKFQSNRSQADAKYIQGSFIVTRQAIAATRDKRFAIAKEIRQNAMGAIHSTHFNVNRMLTGNANAVLCYVNGAVNAATTVTVQTNTSGTDEVDPTQHLNVGDQLVVGTSAEIIAGTAESAEVSSITSGTVFETTANETFVDNDIIIREDAYDLTGAAYTELTGLAALVTNTGTVQNIDKAANFWFQSAVQSGIGALALSDIDATIMKVRRYAIDPSSLFLACNSVQWRRLAALYTTTRNIFDVEKWGGNLVGGVTGLVHYAPDGQYPVFIEEAVPDGVIYIVDPNGYYWGEMAPFQFAEDALSMDGVPGQRKSATLNYEFAFYMFGQFVQTNARSSALLSGITS